MSNIGFHRHLAGKEEMNDETGATNAWLFLPKAAFNSYAQRITRTKCPRPKQFSCVCSIAGEYLKRTGSGKRLGPVSGTAGTSNRQSVRCTLVQRARAFSNEPSVSGNAQSGPRRTAPH